jgi:cysteine desulfurase
MEPYLKTEYGNPSSLHRWGRRARMAIDAARETVAAALNADPAEICFVSSGTESCNLAIIGCALKAPLHRRHILVSAVEHHCVLHAAEWLVPLGYTVEHIPVDHYGQVDPDAVRACIRDETWLVSIMHANNEIGTLQPVEAIGRICQGTRRVVPCGRRADLRAAACGCGSDWVRPAERLGAQGVRTQGRWRALCAGDDPAAATDGRRRAGTRPPRRYGECRGHRRLRGGGANSRKECVPTEAERQTALRDEFIRAVLQAVPSASLTGHPTERLPGNAHFRFAGVPSDSLLIALDRAGIAASSGAACSAGSLEPSHVLLALGWDETAAQEGVRFTLGRDTTWDDLAYTVEVLRQEVARIRATRSPARPTAGGRAVSQKTPLR